VTKILSGRIQQMAGYCRDHPGTIIQAMCGRYNIITDAQAILDAYEIAHTLFETSELHPRYNVAPSKTCP